MSAQDRTLDQYQELMQINAASHLIRAARQLGILEELRGGQRTCGQLCEALSLSATPADLLLDGLVAIGIVEKYEDDVALSQAAQLLCQYDDDLGVAAGCSYKIVCGAPIAGRKPTSVSLNTGLRLSGFIPLPRFRRPRF